MDKLRRALSGEEDRSPDEETGFASQLRDATSLSWTTRIKGFAICFGLGFVLSMLGTFFLVALPLKGIRLFAVFYSIGNILSMSSTCFLMGPMRQLKNMFKPTRILSTITALTFLVLTIVCVVCEKKGLTILCCAIQFLAMTWYSLSYIPYARDAVLKVINI